MFEYITARILHTPLGKRVDELLAKVQALDPPPGQRGPPSRSPSLFNMLDEMANHSRRIHDRISLEEPRPRTAARNPNPATPALPSQESIIFSLYATPVSSPDYNVIVYNHRFPQNAVRCPQRPSRSYYRPPPAYSKTDPNPSISVALSEMGLSVRGGVAPQLPPPYPSLSGPPPTAEDS